MALALGSLVCASLVTSAAIAQQSASPPGGSTPPQSQLPPVVVESKKKAPQAKTKQAKQAKAATPSQGPQQQQTGPSVKAETATGPVKGIVATRSATGTKTDTPLIETPQSISVITADRIQQQAATSVSDALGYTAGVRANVYGSDTRFDWLQHPRL